LTKCDQCRSMWAERNARGVSGEPPCDDCRTTLLEENAEVAEIYLRVRRQVIVAGDQVIDLSIPAVKIVMDLKQVPLSSQNECLNKVMRVFHYFLNKDKPDS